MFFSLLYLWYLPFHLNIHTCNRVLEYLNDIYDIYHLIDTILFLRGTFELICTKSDCEAEHIFWVNSKDMLSFTITLCNFSLHGCHFRIYLQEFLYAIPSLPWLTPTCIYLYKKWLWKYICSHYPQRGSVTIALTLCLSLYSISLRRLLRTFVEGTA